MYLTSVIIQNLVLGTQILMVAVALYIVFSASKIFHIAVGAIGAASAYILFLGLNSGFSVYTSIGFAFIAAIVLGVVSAQLLETYSVKEANLLGLLVSFAFGVIIESVISITFGSGGKSLHEGILPVLTFGGISIDVPGIVTIGLGLTLALLSWAIVQFTSVGRILRGVAENTPLMTSLGVDNKIIRYLAYSVAAVISGIIISLTGWHTALAPLIGFNLIISAFIVLLMGGVTDLKGTIVSSYIVAVIPGLIIGYSSGLSENWRLVFVFSIAAIILSIRPDGIFSKKLREA